MGDIKSVSFNKNLQIYPIMKNYPFDNRVSKLEATDLNKSKGKIGMRSKHLQGEKTSKVYG